MKSVHFCDMTANVESQILLLKNNNYAWNLPVISWWIWQIPSLMRKRRQYLSASLVLGCIMQSPWFQFKWQKLQHWTLILIVRPLHIVLQSGSHQSKSAILDNMETASCVASPKRWNVILSPPHFSVLTYSKCIQTKPSTQLRQKKADVGRDLVVVWDQPPVEEKLAVDEDVYTPPLS